jgi:predicted transcriptional regulator
MKDSRISVRLGPELRLRLRDAARRTGARESDLVRQAVASHLAHAETPFDCWDKTGLIGCVRGAVDLSTNKRHFDGFGK